MAEVEEIEQPQVEQPIDKTKILYDAVSKKYDIGNYDDFAKKLQDPTKRKAFYDGVGHEYDLGSYDEFTNKVGAVKKKDTTSQSSVAGTSSPTQNSGQDNHINIQDLIHVNTTRNTGDNTHLSQPISIKHNAEINVPSDASVENPIEHIQKAKTAAEKYKKQGIVNSTKQYFSNNNIPVKETDPLFQQQAAKLEEGINTGKLSHYVDKNGEDKVGRNVTGLPALTKNWKKAGEIEDLNGKLANGTDKERIDILEKERNDKTPVPYLEEHPSGFGAELGNSGRQLLRGAAGGAVGAAVGLPELGGFLGMAHHSYTAGYSNELRTRYNENRELGLSPEQSLNKAKTQATVGAATSLVTDAVMNKMMMPTKVSGIGNGFIKAVKQDIKHAAPMLVKQSAVAGGAEAGRDLIAKAQGYNEDLGDVLNKSFEAFGDNLKMGAMLHAVTTGAVGAFNLSKKSISQAKEALSRMPKKDVNTALETGVQSGEITQEQAQKTQADLANYENVSKSVPPNLSEEKAGVIKGLIEKKQSLEKQKTELDKSFHPEIDEQIRSIDEKIDKAKTSEHPLSMEVDDLTGQTEHNPKLHEDLSKAEREGIVVPKEYGTAEVEEHGEGDNKTYTPKATFLEKNGALEVSKNIPIEEGKTFKDKNKAQEAADNALGKHYYENALPDNDKPVKKSGVSVIRPEENKPVETTTIAPKEHVPETKESGVTVILPKHEEKIEVQQPSEVESTPTTKNDKVEQPTEEKAIGVTKAETKQQREERGLPDMQVQDTRGLKEMFASGKGMVDEGHIDPRHLAETVAAKPRNLHSDEINALLYDRMKIINEHRGVMNEILNSIESGDLVKEKELRSRAEKLEQARINNEKAVKSGARENALALSTMQNMIKEDYSLASQKAKAIIANNGENLSKETIAKLEKYDNDLQSALKKVEEHEEKITQLSAENEILKAKKYVAEERVRNKAIKKDDIKAERKEIVDKLRAIAKAQQGKLSANPIPLEMIPFLGKLIRNLVREGIVELEDIVRHIHTELKDFVEGVTERDVRDAISGYGKINQLSKDQVEKQVREIKSQGRLVSAIEDAESKKPPLKSGLVKSEPSSKVRELRKKLSDEMKKNGISTVDARKQLKTQLDSVKTRLKNSISDLTNAIEANEKMPKREHGIEYDTEAKELVKQRDEIRAKYDEIFGTSKEWTTEERQEATVKRLQEQLDDLLAKNVKEQKDAVEDTPEIKELRDQVAEAKNKLGLDKSKMLLPEEELNKKVEAALKLYDGVIKKYEERLRKNDTKPEGKRTTLESEELTAKRKVLDDLKEQYKEMYEASEDFEKKKLDDYKKRLQEQLESYQKRLADGDFAPKEKSIPIQLDKKGLELKAQVEEIKAKFDSERKRIERENRPKLEKRLNLLTGWRRMVLLSNIPTLGKLVSAAGYRQATNFMEEIVGTALRQTPLIKDIAAKAEREGSPINFKRELRSLGEWKSKETFRDMKRSVTQGHTSLDYLYGGKHLDEPAGWIDFFGRVHMALKTPAKRAEFLRAYEIRAKKASEAGLDMTDPQAQFEVGVQAYEDANRAIFMQENIVTKGYNQAIRFLEGSGDKGKGAAAMMKIIFPIIKVPTNYVAETSSYAIGAAKAAVALRKGISNLTSEQADYVMRALKKQGIGAAVLALGYFNPQALGGYYTGKRKEDDLKAGDMVLFGMHVPHWMSHAPLIEMLHIGATMRRVRDEGGSLGEATYQAGKGVATQVPFLDQPAKMAKDLGNAESASGYAGGLFRDMTLPPDVQRIARNNDVDENGEKVKRKPIGFIENYEMGIPKLRQKIRTDEQQKRIKQIESQLKGKEFDGIREEMINDVLSEN